MGLRCPARRRNANTVAGKRHGMNYEGSCTVLLVFVNKNQTFGYLSKVSSSERTL